MKTQIEMLENSLRTNLAMSRSLVSKMQLNLARLYLERAKSDKKTLDNLKLKWFLDETKEFKMEF